MILLPYDKGFLELPLPESEKVHLLNPPSSGFKPEGTQEEIVEKALSEPINSEALSKLAENKENIVIITSDHTRPVPSHITMPLILSEIRKVNENAKITLLISTGMHRPMSDEEISLRFGEEVLRQVSVVNHLAEKDEDMVFLGILPSGGELWINRLAMKADLLLAEGFIEPHFFAGYSGGRKSVLPGIASHKTVLFNHNSDFINSPHARTGILKNNPIHKDMVWAVEQSKLAFIVNVIINSKKEIIHCVAGHPIKAHEQGCEFVEKLTAVEPIPADIIVSTNGGYPLDQNVYQAVKGMTAAEATAKSGAIIIMVAGCREGLGGDKFYHQMADASSPKETMEKIMETPNSETEPDQWQSQILARVLLKHKVILVTDPSLAQYVRNMHMEFAPTLEAAFEMAIAEKGRDAVVTVIPDGVGITIKPCE
ncbi:nickel-dependent lactate racemase [Desulfitibacter alkalitolerans]|uniref:nickel-dependent lactate racemase n=1 Tax=Desulfitibacter alkalitolerans TaxID=264641 RepID=UPI00047FB003|nr:nickel-dependent lactate racemase [Desulfitibacter alkalitolerans]